MPQIKLIASDIDGTLLNGQSQLSAKTESVLKSALAAGIQLVLATGRGRTPKVVQVYQQLGLTTPLICLQGGAVHESDGQYRFIHPLDHQLAWDMIRMSQQNGYSMVAYSGLDLFTPQVDEYISILAHHQEPIPQEVGTWENLPAEMPINKLILFDRPDHLPLLRQAVFEIGGSAVQAVQTLPTALEIIPAHISKGLALAEVCVDLGVSMENVMAVGDAENDISMIQAAGWGVAMGNAFESVKAAADYVTLSNNEDGLAAAVEKFVLA